MVCVPVHTAAQCSQVMACAPRDFSFTQPMSAQKGMGEGCALNLKAAKAVMFYSKTSTRALLMHLY